MRNPGSNGNTPRTGPRSPMPGIATRATGFVVSARARSPAEHSRRDAASGLRRSEFARPPDVSACFTCRPDEVRQGCGPGACPARSVGSAVAYGPDRPPGAMANVPIATARMDGTVAVRIEAPMAVPLTPATSTDRVLRQLERERKEESMPGPRSGRSCGSCSGSRSSPSASSGTWPPVRARAWS